MGINYNVIQSKIAIGSAGFFGKGFGQGTQVQLGFLPEAQTDFILAALIEEFGLISGFLAITAFIVLIFRIIRIGIDSEINFNRFICLGAAILFIVQFILNIGSNLGFMPVIGVGRPSGARRDGEVEKGTEERFVWGGARGGEVVSGRGARRGGCAVTARALPGRRRKDAALAEFALDRQASIVAQQDVFYDRQAEAGAAGVARERAVSIR